MVHFWRLRSRAGLWQASSHSRSIYYSDLQVQNKPVFLFGLTKPPFADNFLGCQRRAFSLLARRIVAGVAELADALDSGSSG